jgi:hypothetical protein
MSNDSVKQYIAHGPLINLKDMDNKSNSKYVVTAYV